MRFLKRAKQEDFVADQTFTIPSGGGTRTITDVPIQPDTAIEVQLDDGSIVVLLGYLRK